MPKTFIGVFVPFFFLSTYARNEQGLSYESSLNLVLFLNGIGFIGRLLPSILAYYLGMLNVFTLMVILSSLSMYTWAAVSSTTNLYVWTAFYSLFFGGIQSLLPGALSSLSSDPQKQGTQMGMVFSVLSFGCLIGTPVAGALISGSERGYFDAQIFAGTCLGAGGLLLVAAREVKRGKVSGDLLLKL
jgi:predicted MFS family arabinose efflux permease